MCENQWVRKYSQFNAQTFCLSSGPMVINILTVRSAIRAASQLPGRGSTDIDDAPAPAHL